VLRSSSSPVLDLLYDPLRVVASGMRIVRGKQAETAPTIKLSPGLRDADGNCFAAIARCPCGHDAQLPAEWVALATGHGRELQQARARLRCRKCGGRMPRVEVYQSAL
jgi:hypothetical protein